MISSTANFPAYTAVSAILFTNSAVSCFKVLPMKYVAPAANTKGAAKTPGSTYPTLLNILFFSEINCRYSAYSTIFFSASFLDVFLIIFVISYGVLFSVIDLAMAT